ncbi:hypothetical protein KW843_13805 [Acidovorax sp. sif1233]|uniref:hypothetical protein n=1 Tax=Acidovorax sp. sif1233 TaxID=2854792 RepID=UPI001C486F71|nr:hypothetical protein [Acidovorax sp. sif1233]MBV7455553.1 hypothetical protein [Acidovorax sp. sif1233]
MKNTARTLASLVALVLAHAPAATWAQASCSSDGTPRPTALFERFLSADCEACWTDRAPPAPTAGAGTAVLDWIVPGAAGEDAPLAAAAARDALVRLEALGRKSPRATDVHTAAVQAARPAGLRVAHGMPFNDYLGTAIAFTPGRTAAPGPLEFYLLLVEAVPAGTDGTAVPRNIVRNMLHGAWGKPGQRPVSGLGPSKWMETRSMRIPEGAQAERLRMVGWVQDARGTVIAAAQSTCR